MAIMKMDLINRFLVTYAYKSNKNISKHQIFGEFLVLLRCDRLIIDAVRVV